MNRPNSVSNTLRNENGRTVLETLLTLLFVLIVLIIAIDRFTASINTVREGALRIELSNLRSGVNLFAMTKRRLPKSLNELVTEKVVVTKQGINGVEFKVQMVGRYVESMTVGENGLPLDPFGNTYTFDPVRGMVHTTTAGYESW